MNSPAADQARLATLDLLFSVMHSPERPLDFTIVFQFEKALSIEALRSGASSARNLYPTTASFVADRRWVRSREPVDGVTALHLPSEAAETSAIEEFLELPSDPREQLPVRQLVITNESDGRMKLVTRFHHAAADGLSAALWLGHQLRVATGRERFVAQAAAFEELPLRSHSSPVKKSQFAYRGPSHPLACSRSRPSRTRRWHTIKVEAARLRERCRRTGGFTYNDLLATCALEVFIRWNRTHAAVGHKHKVGLWLPVNIRQQSSSGFGNGTSRIRIYARFADHASLIEKCREVRRQVAWSIRHGEWSVPQNHPLTRLPVRVINPLLRSFLNRPRVDMATALFSHAERWGGVDEIFEPVEQIECIGQLARPHCLAINGATHRGQTWLTFTYDPGLLTADDSQRFVRMYQEQIACAEATLA